MKTKEEWAKDWEKALAKKHKQDKQKVRRILEELKTPVWIGEDGNAVVNCKTERGALIKFRQLIRESVGDLEAEQIKLSDVGESSLFINHDPKFTDDGGEMLEWYVGKGRNGEIAMAELFWLNV